MNEFEDYGLSQEQMDSIIHKNMIFISEDQALEKYNELAGRMGFSVRKGSFHYGVGGLKTSRLIVCNKEGFKEKDSRSKNIRKNKDVRCGCLARLKLKQTKADRWEVVDIVYEHNHVLTPPNLTHMLNSHRKITESYIEADLKGDHIVTDLKGDHIEADCNAETSRRYSDLVHKAVKLATMCAPYEDLTVMAHEFLDNALVKVTDAHRAKQNDLKSSHMSNNTGASNGKSVIVAVGCERSQKRGVHKAKTCFTKVEQKKISKAKSNGKQIRKRKRKSDSGKNEQSREHDTLMETVSIELPQRFDMDKDNTSHTHHETSFTELLHQDPT